MGELVRNAWLCRVVVFIQPVVSLLIDLGGLSYPVPFWHSPAWSN